jgi:putative nucleotidyltransferase with HDIG domain
VELMDTAGDDAENFYRTAASSICELAKLGMSQGRPVVQSGVGEANQSLGPTVVAPLLCEGEAIGAVVALNGRGSDFDTAQIDGISTLASLASVAMRNADLRDSQRNFFSHMTDIVVTALDSHLDYHSGHGSRAAHNANRVGRTLDFDHTRLQNLHFAALLHDIGMLKFDRTARKNPKICEKHTVIGMRLLGRIRLWEDVAPMVQSHHEWFDGTGYPEGLVGEDIPLESRIIAVCDAFDAMTSNTSYQIALPLDAACDEIRRGSGTQFDPQVATTFLQLAERGELDDGSTP